MSLSRPLGGGGKIDLLWPPVTRMRVGVCLSASICTRQSLQMAFKFSDVVTMDKALN